MRRQAITIWLALVTMLAAGNLALGIAFWSLADQENQADNTTRSESDPTKPTVRGTPPDPVEKQTPKEDPKISPPIKPPDKGPSIIPDVPKKKLSGDLLLLVLDTSFFRKHEDAWGNEMRAVQTAPLGGRLLGGTVYRVDRKEVTSWDPGQPLPEGKDTFENEDFRPAFEKALAAINKLSRQAESPRLKVFLFWCSDVDPDGESWTENLSSPSQWIRLVWHGRPDLESMAFNRWLGPRKTIPLKQDPPSGLVNHIEASLPPRE